MNDRLIAALEAGDEMTVRRLGWSPVLELADTGWAPRQRCTPQQFVPYAKLVGDEDPAAVLEAFTALAGEWRPHPAAVRGELNRKRNTDKRMDAGRSRDTSRSTDALDAVREALVRGEHVCGCGGPVGRKWKPDSVDVRSDANGRRVAIPVGVWRCPECHGVEPGQAFAAEDLETRHEDAAAA